MSNSTAELIQAAVKNKALVITCTYPDPSAPGYLLLLCPMLILLKSCIFTLSCPLIRMPSIQFSPLFHRKSKNEEA